MDKKYISVDVETSGATPGKYSMLSLGACVVGDTGKQFYREIKPLNHNYDPEAMKVACLGLKCLKDLGYRKEHDPKSPDFSPISILRTLEEKAEEPKKNAALLAAYKSPFPLIENALKFVPVLKSAIV